MVDGEMKALEMFPEFSAQSGGLEQFYFLEDEEHKKKSCCRQEVHI